MNLAESYGVRRPAEIAAKTAKLRARIAPISQAPVVIDQSAPALIVENPDPHRGEIFDENDLPFLDLPFELDAPPETLPIETQTVPASPNHAESVSLADIVARIEYESAPRVADGERLTVRELFTAPISTPGDVSRETSPAARVVFRGSAKGTNQILIGRMESNAAAVRTDQRATVESDFRPVRQRGPRAIYQVQPFWGELPDAPAFRQRADRLRKQTAFIVLETVLSLDTARSRDAHSLTKQHFCYFAASFLGRLPVEAQFSGAEVLAWLEAKTA